MKKIAAVVAVFCFLGIVLSGCGLTPAPQRAIDYDQVGPKDKLILRFSYVTGEDTPKGLAARKFKELVEKRSGGKVEVQLFPNATLYSDQEELSELKQGEIQLIAPAISKLSDIVPEVQLFDLPFLFSSSEEVWKLVQSPLGQQLNQLLAQQGYKVLAVWDNGFKELTNDQHPIKKPEDMRDMTFRIMSSDALAKQFAAVGANTVVLPFDQLYLALEKGKVQGEENTVSNIVTQKLYTSQKYITKSDHGYLGYFVLADQKFWQSIPEDRKSVVEKALQEVTEWERNMAISLNKKQYEELKNQQGIHIYELNAAEKKAWKQKFGGTYKWFSSQISSDLMKGYFQEELK